MTAIDRIDGVLTSTAIKAPCRVATTVSVTHVGLLTMDGVTLADGDRVLDKNNADGTLRGIWVARVTAWERAKDFDGNRDAVKGTTVKITDGSTYAGTNFRVSSANPIVIGTSIITFAQDLTADADSINFVADGSTPVTQSVRRKLRRWVEMEDHGDPSDVNNNTAAFNDAKTAIESGGVIDFGSGLWRGNFLVNKFMRLHGSGGLRPRITSYDANGDTFTVAVNNGSWALQAVFEDMDIRGSGLTGGNGVVLGGTPWATATAYAINRVVVSSTLPYVCVVAHTSGTFATDLAAGKWSLVTTDLVDFAGRIDMSRCLISSVNRCVYKPFGSIGNTFRRVMFGNANFHMHATSVTGAQHAGCDMFLDLCHFQEAQIACLLYDSGNTGTGQLLIENAIMEANPGFGLFVLNFNSEDWAPGIVLRNVWNEGNCGGGVNVLGAPVFAHLYNAGHVVIEGTRLTTFDLQNTKVIASKCHGDLTFNVASDPASSFRCHDYHDNGGAGASPGGVLVNSVVAMEVAAGNFRGAVSMPHPTAESFAYQANILYSETFSGALAAFSSGTTTAAAGGPIFDQYQTLSYTADSTLGVVSATVNKFVVVMLTVKLVSGVAPTLGIASGTSIGTFGTIDNADWKTRAFYCEVVSSAGAGLYCFAPSSGTTVLAFGGFAYLQFDTEQQAINFINAGVFPIVAGNIPREASGTVAPAAGTWTRGDRCWNTTPSAAGVPGWVCTTGGSPGTWKAMAALAA